METVDIKPNFDRLNIYFRYWNTEETYLDPANNSNYSLLEIIPQSYRSYLKNEKIELVRKAKNFSTDININSFQSLLEKYNLNKHFDDLLFVTEEFREILPFYKKRIGSTHISRKKQIEYYKILKFLISNFKQDLNSAELRIQLIHKGSVSEMQTSDPLVTIAVLYGIENGIFNKYMHYSDFGNRFIRFDELSVDYIDSNLQSLKLQPGNKKGINQYYANFIRNVVDYLNCETPLKAGNFTITNEQCRFILNLLEIIGVVEDEKKDYFNENNIRSILKNDLKSKYSKSAK